jgi:hypothetical protein
LVIFLHDDQTGRPLSKVPVYAEVVLRFRPLMAVPELCTARFDGWPELRDIVVDAIRDRVDPQWFSEHCEEFSSALVEPVVDAVVPHIGPLTDEAPARVREIVDRLAAEANAPYPQTVRGHDQRIPLGLLASDHAGFVSFDLVRLNGEHGMTRDVNADAFTVEIDVYPLLLEAMRFPVLEQQRIGPDAIVGKLGLPMSDHLLTPAYALNLPAMQNPDLIDWRLSPGSFAAVPQSLVGADGCESFTPANFAISDFQIRQVVRLADETAGTEPAAFVNEYTVSIVPIGHSLGQVLYTLPLAPGESVRLAVIDWRRSDHGVRDEKTKVTESLLHDQTHDRTVSETVHAALEEWQRGGSVMGGLAGGAGASGPSGLASVAGGGMLSVGGGYATSSGSRDLTGETVQKITEAIHQSSVAQRELTSSVVVQMDQTEKEAIETRAFANHNRGHTLTVIYYEVLRHFRVVTEFRRRYRAVLLPRTKWHLGDEALVLNKRFLLEPALLDGKLSGAFDALTRLDARRREAKRNPPVSAPPAGEADFVISQVDMHFKVGGEESPNAVSMWLCLKDGSKIILPVGGSVNLNGTEQFNDEQSGFMLTSDAIPGAVKWGDVSHMEISKTSGSTTLHLDFVEAFALGDFGSRQLVKHPPGKHYEFEDADDRYSLWTEKPAPTPPLPPTKHPEQEVSLEDYQLGHLLIEHLAAEEAHYSRILDLSTHPDVYAAAFESRPWSGGGATIDAVAPTPLEILGTKIAFPLLKQEDEPIDVPTGERLISLPTRGVFAEAKLGHCSVAEEIDETRFWRWGEHALPFTATEIAAIQAAEPERAPIDLDASKLPAPVVNIQNTPALPEPSALAAALKVLGTAEIFRDMSAGAEVGALLSDLVSGSVSMAGAADRARKIQAKAGAPGSGSTGRGGGWDPGGGGRPPGGGAAPSPDPWFGQDVPGLGTASGRRDSPREQYDQLQTLNAYHRAGVISDEEKRAWGADYIHGNLSFSVDASTLAALGPFTEEAYLPHVRQSPERTQDLSDALAAVSASLPDQDKTRLGKVAFAVIKVSDATDPLDFAGHLATDMFFAGSLLKASLLPASFQLVAEINKMRWLLRAPSEAGFFAGLGRAFDAKIAAAVPTISPGFWRRVSYRKMLKATPEGADTYTVALSDEQQADLTRMFAEQDDNAPATRSIRRLGFSYLNGALAAGKFLDLRTANGIWLATDFVKDSKPSPPAFPSFKIPVTSGGKTSAGTSCIAMARMLASMAQGNLVDSASAKEMMKIFSLGGAWLHATTGAGASMSYTITGAKVGHAASADAHVGSVKSEAAFIKRKSDDALFAATWVNLPDGAGTDDALPVYKVIDEVVKKWP